MSKEINSANFSIEIFYRKLAISLFVRCGYNFSSILNYGNTKFYLPYSCIPFKSKSSTEFKFKPMTNLRNVEHEYFMYIADI